VSRVAAVIMHPPLGDSTGETLVKEGRLAGLLDLVTALEGAGIEEVYLVTPDQAAGEMLGRRANWVFPTTAPFHFGEELKGIVSRYKIDRLLYFGSGSGVLLSEAQVKSLVGFTARSKPRALFNNFYSCDFAAISRAKELLYATLPRIDNALGFALADAGFPCFSLPRSAATQFDIDTPTDLLLLGAGEEGGPNLRAAGSRYGLIHPTLSALTSLLTSRSAHLYLIGRVNPLTWAWFEERVACRTSALVEGRGMRAYPQGREPILGRIIKEKGIDAFIEWLSAACDGAIIDTRPLLARQGALPPARDRFASDLLRADLIEDPVWAAFTTAALEAEIPIVLGGHSLVSGGLYLLPKLCWKGHDLPRRLHPETIDWEKE